MSFALLLQAPAGGSPYGQLIMFGAIFVIFYFFMIRPQQKKAKEAKAFLTTLKVGDKIVTLGGLHGTIAALDTDTVEVDIARGVRVTYDRSAISVDSTRRVQGVATK